jgi:hypothetical protein
MGKVLIMGRLMGKSEQLAARLMRIGVSYLGSGLKANRPDSCAGRWVGLDLKPIS